MYCVNIYLCLLIAAITAGCTSFETKVKSGQPESSVSRNQQIATNANVFSRKGQYETNSSFEKRQAAVAAADMFFSNIGSENCVIKSGLEDICYRAIDGGSYQIYRNGIAISDGRWKRVHNTFCVDNSCQPVAEHEIKTFVEYKKLYSGNGPDAVIKLKEVLQGERGKLVVRSMVCFRCRQGRWQSSIAKIFQLEPHCNHKLDSHRKLYGDLDIKNIQVAVSDSFDGESKRFLTAMEVPDSEYISKVDFRTLSVKRSALCSFEPQLVRIF